MIEFFKIKGKIMDYIRIIEGVILLAAAAVISFGWAVVVLRGRKKWAVKKAEAAQAKKYTRNSHS